ncbi:MAG: hypothetical protein WBV94_09775 [Blastocatellia bacterium]
MSDIAITEQTTAITVIEESTTVQVVESEQILVTEIGIQGPAGPPGIDLFYQHDQLVASDTWTINHQLGKHPAITVVDSGGNVVVGDITYNDINTAIVYFSVPFGGNAYCN